MTVFMNILRHRSGYDNLKLIRKKVDHLIPSSVRIWLEELANPQDKESDYNGSI